MTELGDTLDRPVVAGPFRPIHYLGSKARMLGQIEEAVATVNPLDGEVVDLFSGSGVVSEALGQRWPVIAVDIQEYARVLASALSAPARLIDDEIEVLLEAARTTEIAGRDRLAPLLEAEDRAIEAVEAGDPDPLAAIIETGSLSAFERAPAAPVGEVRDALAAVCSDAAGRQNGAIARVYGGVYFSYRQGLALDALLAVARSFEGEDASDTLLAAAFGAASATVTSVGNHFAQPLRPRDKQGRPKLSALRVAAQRRRRNVFEIFADRLRQYRDLRGATHEVGAVRADYRAFLDSPPARPSVVYADPPYTRDHYSRFYHVLETMALGDEPGLSEVSLGGDRVPSRGLYREDRHQSPFCINSQVREAFRDLFVGARSLDAALVLSYSPYESGTAARPRPRLLQIEDLTEMAAAHFGRVELRAAGVLRHSKLNAKIVNGLALDEAETLIVCVP
jgi:adenine-specific DNA-methyltransferase